MDYDDNTFIIEERVRDRVIENEGSHANREQTSPKYDLICSTDRESETTQRLLTLAIRKVMKMDSVGYIYKYCIMYLRINNALLLFYIICAVCVLCILDEGCECFSKF